MKDPLDRFTESEMARILERASEQGSLLPAVSSSDGFTLAEIESIAAEAGLDTRRIRAAAVQVALDRSRGRFGDTGRIDLRGSVPGVVSSREFGQLAETIGDAAGAPGVRNSAFGALEWENPRGADRLHVTVTPGDANTSLRVRADASAVKGLCYVASVGGALALGGITGAILEPTSVIAGVGIMVGAATAGVATGWTVWRTQARALRNRAASVMAAVSDRAAEIARSADEGQESR